uniref:Uncharacterized protein n=1 Tax=Ananas comosus var. bracteatus TaxID=296719 RepID=A0A6V7PHT3_ANACO|nr:unnamed protein product [Ananas comosus var. bracteatus]
MGNNFNPCIFSIQFNLLSLFCFCFSLQCSASCHPADRSALLAFKAAITADPGASSAPGTRPPPMPLPNAALDGVALDYGVAILAGTLSPALGNLTGLRILGLTNLIKLTGPLPPSLGRLSLLTDLRLFGNDLTGPIPSSFSSLHRLEFLLLNDNRLSGVIPPSVFASPALTFLTLYENQFTGAIPRSIGKLSALERLDLRSNDLSGKIPMEIGNLRNLTYLDLSKNRISGSIPKSIGNLIKLAILDLSENHLTGAIPHSFTKMVSLQFCRLSSNRLSGILPPSIGDLRSMQRWFLSGNELTGEIPESIRSLSSLNTLFFSNNRFTGKIPAGIGNLARLQILDLSRNNLTGPIPDEIAGHGSLQLLDLSFNPINQPTLPSWLGKMPGLFKLHLAGIGVSGPMPEWLAAMPSLGVLDLSSNKLSGKLPPWVGNMTGLATLNLSRNELRSAIPESFKNLARLMELDLSDNELYGPIRPVLAKATSDALGHYTTLDLSRNRFTGGVDEDVGELAATGAVERFAVSGNPELGGQIPGTMAKMASLTELRMAGDGLEGGIPEGVLDLPALQVFDVSDNRLTGRIPPHRCGCRPGGLEGTPGSVATRCRRARKREEEDGGGGFWRGVLPIASSSSDKPTSSFRRLSLSHDDAPTSSARSDPTPRRQSQGLSRQWRQRRRPEIPLRRPLLLDLLHVNAVADLTEIAGRMIRAGYDQELSQMYIAVRRDAIAETLAALDVNKISIEEVQRIEWSTLDSKMKKWIHALKIAVRVLLSGEGDESV